ncbi:hypothetical protein L1077_14980 [Pseudoalteromonas luteoviolacea]|uniref:hypothetical protein n=1 Tax=Pseudoalteromonas luteoviolacea TaxID=43657 RepID=UPI001F463DB5|nr:hypothetical protein [Pseudoalteromonas luteoviolacea]MCF6440738.1 hypothetical protein [Pseudoalteromonas luteoviolacea]
MAFALHITKENGDISFPDWVEAVLKTQGANLEGQPTVGRNPKTGEIITVGGKPHNVSVQFPENEEWQTCIFFNDGVASFNGTSSMIDDEKNPVRLVAKSIANFVDAKIVGDEGEVYDW